MPLINRVGGGGADLQSGKSATPTTSPKTYYPDAGYDGFSNFKVNAIPSEYVKPSATQTAQTITPGTSDKSIAAETYCSGEQTIKGDADLVAANIKSGVSIFGVVGTYLQQGYIENEISAYNDGYYSSLSFSLNTSNLIGFFVASYMEPVGHTGVEEGEKALLSLFVDINKGFHIETYWQTEEDSMLVVVDGSHKVSGGVTCSDGTVTVTLSDRYLVSGAQMRIYPIYSK